MSLSRYTEWGATMKVERLRAFIDCQGVQKEHEQSLQ